MSSLLIIPSCSFVKVFNIIVALDQQSWSPNSLMSYLFWDHTHSWFCIQESYLMNSRPYGMFGIELG